MTEQEQALRDLIEEADELIWTARGAARKIDVERRRKGAGYQHAKVDWLLRDYDRLESFRSKVKDAIAAVPSASTQPVAWRYRFKFQDGEGAGPWFHGPDRPNSDHYLVEPLYIAPQQAPSADADCICQGNWRAIVKETEHLLERRFVSHDGKTCTFFGIVHGNDDYYYGMQSKKHGLRLLSCVSNIEGHGYTLATSPKAPSADASAETPPDPFGRWRVALHAWKSTHPPTLTDEEIDDMAQNALSLQSTSDQSWRVDGATLTKNDVRIFARAILAAGEQEPLDADRHARMRAALDRAMAMAERDLKALDDEDAERP